MAPPLAHLVWPEPAILPGANPELPIAVQRAVAEQSKGATVRELVTEHRSGQTRYEAELAVDAHGVKVD